jgi:hypothetical protein
MTRYLWTAAALAGVLVTPAFAADDDDSPKAALQALQEYIGQWNATGGPDKSSKPENWKEVVNWSWRFSKKGDDTWLAVEFKDGKYFSGGELRFVPEKKKYVLTLAPADKKAKDKLAFEGELKKGFLTLDRADPESGDVQRLTLNTAGDGTRFIYKYAILTKGKGVPRQIYQVVANKEGESLASSGKKNECIVTGGLGTMAVSYGGKTYYVCCSGCRDAFNENPEKFVNAKKK